MTLEDLRLRKKSLVLSTTPGKRVGGKAYSEVEEEFEKMSEKGLSEEVSIMKAAKRCYEKEMKSKKPDPMKLKYFKEFYVKTLSYNDTKFLLEKNGARTLEDAEALLKSSRAFMNVDPDVVRRITGR
jgi:hypothetical protein